MILDLPTPEPSKPSYPSREELLETNFLFTRSDAVSSGVEVGLQDDGSFTMAASARIDPARWRVEGGTLEFLDPDGRLICRFVHMSREHDGRVFLRGEVLDQADGNLVYGLDETGKTTDKLQFQSQTKLRLKPQIDAFGWTVGDHTYGGPRVYASGPERLHIGKYCAIAEEVTIVLANHRFDYVSIYPFVLFREFWPEAPTGVSDHAGKGDVVIGNDVWIGHGAFIAPGVRIGDGAVVGALSVVTKEVPAYAIVAGNPARVIRYRFSRRTIHALQQVAWWNWSDAKVKRFLPLILSKNIQPFIDAAMRPGLD